MLYNAKVLESIKACENITYFGQHYTFRNHLRPRGANFVTTSRLTQNTARVAAVINAPTYVAIAV